MENSVITNNSYNYIKVYNYDIKILCMKDSILIEANIKQYIRSLIKAINVCVRVVYLVFMVVSLNNMYISGHPF